VGTALIRLIPEVIGSIAMPSWVMLVLALLSSVRGVAKAAALVAGITSVRLCQGLIFGTVASAYELSHGINSSEAIVSALLIVLGVLLWAMALWNVVRTNDVKLMSFVGVLTPLKAFGLGALLIVTSSRAWIFTLAAFGVIERARLDIPQSVIAYLLYVLGAQALLIAPILMSTRSTVRVEAAASWLQKYNRPIVVIVSVAVGCYFLWLGITGLIR
jgi:hypothetical protein